MANIACRWPGGTTLVLKRANQPVLTVALKGPGKVDAAPAIPGRPTRAWARTVHAHVHDTMEQLAGSREHEHHEMRYVANVVPDAFWRAWLEQNRNFDLVKQRVVFELPSAKVAHVHSL